MATTPDIGGAAFEVALLGVVFGDTPPIDLRRIVRAAGPDQAIKSCRDWLSLEQVTAEDVVIKK